MIALWAGTMIVLNLMLDRYPRLYLINVASYIFIILYVLEFGGVG